MLGGLETCPQKDFLESICLQRRIMPLHKLGEIGRVKNEEQLLPLLPPWKRTEGPAAPTAPLSVGVPGCGC